METVATYHISQNVDVLIQALKITPFNDNIQHSTLSCINYFSIANHNEFYSMHLYLLVACFLMDIMTIIIGTSVSITPNTTPTIIKVGHH